MTTSDPKPFDCVEMKREGALRVHERIASMTMEEKLAYWRRRSEELRNLGSSRPEEDPEDEASA